MKTYLSDEDRVIRILKGNDYKSVLERATAALGRDLRHIQPDVLFRNTNNEYGKFIQEVVLSDWDPNEFKELYFTKY